MLTSSPAASGPDPSEVVSAFTAEQAQMFSELEQFYAEQIEQEREKCVDKFHAGPQEPPFDLL